HHCRLAASERIAAPTWPKPCSTVPAPTCRSVRSAQPGRHEHGTMPGKGTEVAEEEQRESGVPRQVATGERFGHWWTVLSFGIAVIPAKLGEVYRAYLARRRLGVTLSRTVGTIQAERVLDLVVQFSLLLVTALVTFQAPLLSAHGSSVRLVVLIGLALVVGA